MRSAAVGWADWATSCFQVAELDTDTALTGRRSETRTDARAVLIVRRAAEVASTDVTSDALVVEAAKRFGFLNATETGATCQSRFAASAGNDRTSLTGALTREFWSAVPAPCRAGVVGRHRLDSCQSTDRGGGPHELAASSAIGQPLGERIESNRRSSMKPPQATRQRAAVPVPGED